jgi:hypothetical protein
VPENVLIPTHARPQPQGEGSEDADAALRNAEFGRRRAGPGNEEDRENEVAYAEAEAEADAAAENEDEEEEEEGEERGKWRGVDKEDRERPAAGEDEDPARRGVAVVLNHVYMYNSAPGTDRSVRLHGEGFSFQQPLEVVWQWLKVPVVVDSVLRVDARSTSAHSSLRLLMFANSNQTLEPLLEIVHGTKTTLVYRLAPSQWMYFLGVGSLTTPSEHLLCPSFGLDLSMAPDTALRFELFTALECVPALPERVFNVSESGYGSQELPNGQWQSTFAALETSVSFTVTRDSFLSAVLRHNFLSAVYSLTLEKKALYSNVHYILLNGQDISIIPDEPATRSLTSTARRAHYSRLHVARDMDYEVAIRGFISKGSYTLFIRESLGPELQRMFDTKVPACHHFSWDVKVEPFHAHRTGPTVDPALFETPDRPRRAPQPQQRQTEAQSTPTEESRAPQQPEQPQQPQHPERPQQPQQPEQPQSAPVDDRPSARRNRAQPPVHERVQCLNGGYLDPHATDPTCVCPSGFGGLDCSRCAEGFHRDPRRLQLRCIADHPNQRFREAEQPSRQRCERTTCGCRGVNVFAQRVSESEARRCLPIGRCSESEGVVRCACPPNFAGPFCERCAESYTRYPVCEPVAGAHRTCEHSCTPGVCDSATGECLCPEGWTGPFCNVVAPPRARLGLEGAGLYVVYAATFTTCVIVVLALLLHYKQRRGQARNRYFQLKDITQSRDGL